MTRNIKSATARLAALALGMALMATLAIGPNVSNPTDQDVTSKQVVSVVETHDEKEHHPALFPECSEEDENDCTWDNQFIAVREGDLDRLFFTDGTVQEYSENFNLLTCKTPIREDGYWFCNA